MVQGSGRLIARETLGSAYIRDNEGAGKTETVGIGNSVEQI